jgi:hypothetical protein
MRPSGSPTQRASPGVGRLAGVAPACLRAASPCHAKQPAHQGGLAVVHMAENDDLELLGCGPAGVIGDACSNPWKAPVGAHRRISITCIRPAAASRTHPRSPGPAPGPPAPERACARSSSTISCTVRAVRLDRGMCTGSAADAPVAFPLLVREVERDDGDLLALDVFPDVQLRPVQQRVDADVGPFGSKSVLNWSHSSGGWSSTFHSMFLSRGLK